MTLLLLAACSDHALSTLTKEAGEPVAKVRVTPDALDFWRVGADEAAVLSFTVLSLGDALLRVDDVTIAAGSDFTLVEPLEPFSLAPGESRDIPVTFTPTRPDVQTGMAVVASNDEDAPEVTVALTGEGRVPSLLVTPEAWDFSIQSIPCAEELELVLQNVGEEDLVLGDVRYVGDDQLTLRDADTLPEVLGPGDYAILHVDYLPSEAGAAEGALEVDSNDPAGTRVATQQGEGVATGLGEDHFVAEEDPPVDIVFAVDQSCSMDDDAARLGDEIPVFASMLSTLTSDWQLGVVTYDDGCLNGGILTMTSADLATTFSDAAQLGVDVEIAHDEAFLQLSSTALDEADAGGCNEGLLRDGAHLHVIVVSDEPERSVEEATAWTWSWWVAKMQAHVASPDLLTISGVIDTDGCSEGAGGYAEAIAETGGVALSLCSGDWAGHVADLAAATVASAWTFVLSGQPVPETVVVAVDGVPVTTGWTYELDANAVVFDVLVPGSAVDVTYTLAGTCP